MDNLNSRMVDGWGKPVSKESMLETLYRDIEARYSLKVVAADVQINSRDWHGVLDVRFTLEGGKTVDCEHTFRWANTDIESEEENLFDARA